MATRPPPLDEETARQKIRSYIFHHRHGTERMYVPHRIPPEIASEVILQDLKDDADPLHIEHACFACRFYLLRDCLDHIESFLDARVQEIKDAMKFMSAIRLLGDLGEHAKADRAATVFDQLVDAKVFEKVAESMIKTFFHLRGEASPEKLKSKLEEIYKKRASKLADPKRPDTPTNLAKNLAHYKYEYMMAARRHKQSLLTAKPEPRAAGISRLYLGMSEFGIYGQEWAGYALIREADGSGDADVVNGMRQAYAGFGRQEFEEGTEDVEDIKRDVAGRAFHTIEYFEGDLSEDEKKVLEKDPPPPQNMYTPT